ncbi:MAG: DUF4097 family beta strand repeat-containing protein [bacterium]|nr:DUF4097 family beta strand repeat-containing protein [bacterium]
MIKRLFKLIIFALIIFAIYGFVSGKFNVFKKFMSKDFLYSENKVIYDDIKQIDDIDINLSYSNLIIKKGDNFIIETNNKNIKLENENNEIEIKEEKISVSINVKDSNLIITIPDNQIFNDFELTTGAGTIEIENLSTKELSLKQGAGKVEIEKVEVLDEAKIRGGAGTLIINNANFYNLDLTIGVGKCEISSVFKGNNKITAGVGDLTVNLFNSLDDYKIKIEKDLGNITVNNEKISDDFEYGNGFVGLNIKGSVGNINLNSNENNE